LPTTSKSQEIFRLTALCHISIRVEIYRCQNGLTQCHNCQQFGHVWANCKQPPRCMWCRGGHLRKECPEKENAASTPACCNCQLAEGEKPHPANFRGCKHAKDELQKKKSQRTPKTTTGRVFSSNLTMTGVSFAALPGSTAQTTTAGAPSSCDRSTCRNKIEHPGVWTTTKRRSVSSGSNCKQPTSRQYVESSNCGTTNYDRVKWCCVRRRQNRRHYQNCVKLHESK
jgi:hypothetical protein